MKTDEHTLLPLQLKTYLAGNTSLKPAEQSRILKCFKPVEVKKNAVLLKEGEASSWFYYIERGCLRTYYLTAHGSEKTRHIGFEGSLITSLTSFISGKPSFEWVDAPESSQLLAISREDFFTLINDIEAWHMIYRQFVEQAYMLQTQRTEALVTLSAK